MRFLKCKSDYHPTPLTPPNFAMVPCCLQNENRLLTGIQGLHSCCVTHLLSLPCHALSSVAPCICCAPSGLRFIPLLMLLLFLEHPSFPWLFGNCFFSEFQSGVLSFSVNLPTPGSPLFLFSKHHPSVLHLFDCMFLSQLYVKLLEARNHSYSLESWGLGAAKVVNKYLHRRMCSYSWCWDQK